MKKKNKKMNSNIITVKNAESDADTKAEIVVQNKINYTPKVSVVIPVYNVEQYLRQCLDSVVNQTLREIEIICVDDGSTDSSLDILKEYAAKDKRISVLKQENLHAGVARNAGLAVAKGEYLSFLDSDDFFELTMLEESYSAAKESDADVIVFNAREYNTLTGTYNSCKFPLSPSLFPDKEYASAEEFGEKLFQANSCLAWNKLLKAPFVKKTGLKCGSTKSCNDNVFIYGLLTQAKRIKLYNKEFVNYRTNNPNSLQRSKANSWECVCQAYVALKQKMQEMNVYQYHRRTFANKVLQSCIYYWSTIYGPNKRKLYNALIDKYFDLLDIKDYGEEYYYNKSHYNILTSMVSTSIPIILSADDNYAPFMYTTMYSILSSAHQNTFYDFYLMVPEVFSPKNRTHIENLKKQFNCDIHFLNMKDAFSDLAMHITHITSPTYYRLLAGDLLPQEYNKCIYLDVDTCVCKDLSPLFNTEMGNNYIAGVKAPAYIIKSEYHENRLKIPDATGYINAGVLLMNLRKIREDGLTKRFVDLSKQNYQSQDQDVINVACYGKILTLPLKYNVMTKYPAFFDHNHKTYKKLEDIYGADEINSAIKNPVIIHYADKLKPWDDPTIKMADIWWEKALHSDAGWMEKLKRLKSASVAVEPQPKNIEQPHKNFVSETHTKPKPTKYMLSYKFFKYIPLYTYKKRGGNQVWKIFGLPIWRMRKIADTQSLKYYLFGLPLFEIEKKGCKF